MLCYVCNREMEKFRYNNNYYSCNNCNSKFAVEYEYKEYNNMNSYNIEQDIIHYNSKLGYLLDFIKNTLYKNICINLGNNIPILPILFSDEVYNIGLNGYNFNEDFKNKLNENINGFNNKKIFFIGFNILSNEFEKLLNSIINKNLNKDIIISLIHTLEKYKYEDIIKILSYFKKVEHPVYILIYGPNPDRWNGKYQIHGSNRSNLSMLSQNMYRKIIRYVFEDINVMFDRNVDEDFILFFKLKK